MIYRLALLLAIVVALPPPNRVSAQDATYDGRLRQALTAVQQARASQGAERAAAVRRARELVAAPQKPASPARTPAPYLGHVESALRAHPPDLKRAEGYLRSLLGESEQQSAQASGASEEAALRSVLREPRFAPRETPGWLGRVGRWIGRVLDRLLPDSVGGPSIGRGGLSIPEWLLVLGCVALVAGAVFLILRSAQTRGHEAGGGEVDGERTAPLTSGSALAAATAHAQRGEYRSAVRAQFLALLLNLHEQGRLRYDRSLTNREHLARIGRDTPLAEDLRPLVRVFDDVWYGNASIEAEEYALFQRRAEALRGGAA